MSARMARRAVLAMLAEDEQTIALRACDAIEEIARRGSGWNNSLPVIQAMSRIRRRRENEAALEAVRWAFDSVGAAQGAYDFPVDATVGASAQRCMDAITADRRVSGLQVAMLMAGDIDQIAFACSEVNVGMYDALPSHVFGRLAPCHPLTLGDDDRARREMRR